MDRKKGGKKDWLKRWMKKSVNFNWNCAESKDQNDTQSSRFLLKPIFVSLFHSNSVVLFG